MSKKLMIMQGTLIFIICATLIVLGNIGNDFTLYKLERNIKLSANNYLKDNNRVPSFDHYEVVYISELLENEMIEEDSNIEKYCIKGVKITNKLIINKYEIIKECKIELKNEE